jgi:hypothetical protein
MPNLIKVHVIKCLLCYDLGQIIDPFDQGKRKPCPCRTDPPQHWQCPCLVEYSQSQMSHIKNGESNDSSSD